MDYIFGSIFEQENQLCRLYSEKEKETRSTLKCDEIISFRYKLSTEELL